MKTNKEPTFDEFKEQIRVVLKQYSTDENQQAALLSGMSLASAFLARLDGSKIMTAATVNAAVMQVGTELGFVPARLERN